MKFANLIIRGIQILCCAVILGLSITAIRWQKFGTAPATTSYSAFAGAFGIVIGLIGIAASVFDAIPQLTMGVIDAVASLLLLAGGIAFAVQIHGATCSSGVGTPDNFLMNGGCRGKGDKSYCGYEYSSSTENEALSLLKGRCKTVSADTVFLFLGFLTSLGAASWCYLALRRSGTVPKRGPSTVSA